MATPMCAYTRVEVQSASWPPTSNHSLSQHSIELIERHLDRDPFYTATRLPLKLVYSEQYPSRIEALSAEKQIQGWSRKKKEALISGDWDMLSYLAQRKKK